MEIICNKKDCTGCTACSSSCPKDAISMVEDKCGFLYPSIDQSKCIDCGLCKKTCPVINNKNNDSINKCYVGYANEMKYKINSSSGGIFTIIATKILEDNGIVIGAAFNEDNKLIHYAIDKKEDLYKLQGSKYLQSNLDNIFKVLKEYLNDKKVLFVGTPCQIAGLKAYLKKDYNNLITIDLFCHGVPSPRLFDKYIKELETKYNDKLINYNFRDKSTGWDNYSNKASFNKKEAKELQVNNDYMKLFLSDVALRESCYNCNFKLGNKYSDITLGDFWGVNNYHPDMYNKEGVSAIIINTEKGNDIFNRITEYLTYKECKLDEISSGNPSLVRSSDVSINKRNRFFIDMENNSIEYLVKKYKRKNSIFKRIIKKILKIK